MAQLLKPATTLLLLSALPAMAAELLNDPTRPAPEFMPPSQQNRTVEAEVLTLQSILLSPQRKIAIISGRTVSIGESILGHQLQSLGNRSATLKGPKGTITLQLLPSIRSESAPAGLKKSQGDQQ